MKKSAPWLIVCGIGFTLLSCEGDRVVDPAATGPSGPVPPPQPVVGDATANTFLASDYAPLENWMNDRFKIRYENMPLTMVFDQEPISDIHYQFINLPENSPVFELVSPSISRREILQELARFYDLDMSLTMVDGKPNYVVVRGKGAPAFGSTTAISSDAVPLETPPPPAEF